MALEIPTLPHSALEIILGTQRLRDQLPLELRDETDVPEFLAKLGASPDESDLPQRFAAALEQIANSMEETPVEILPIISWPAIDNDWKEFHEELIARLRKRNLAAFDFNLADPLPDGCTFTRIIWLIPRQQEFAASLPSLASSAIPQWTEAATNASVFWITLPPDTALAKKLISDAKLPRQTRLIPVSSRETSAVVEVLRAIEVRHEAHREGSPPMNDSPEGQRDRLGISPDAAAFARIITDVTLSPPLAIAVFGNWGSGKSFFMRQIDARIKERQPVSGKPRSEPHGAITRTVWFNAWHYVESDLWASLAATIFDCLNGTIAKPSGPGAARVEQREEIVGQMKITQLAIGALEQEAQARVSRLEDRKQQLQTAATAKAEHLVDLKAGVDVVFKAVGKELNTTDAITKADKAKIDSAKQSVQDLIGTARNTQEEWRQIQARNVFPKSFRELKNSWRRYAVALVAVALVASTPFWVPWPWLSGVYTKAWAKIAAAVLLLSPYAKAVLSVTRRFSAARKEYEEVLAKKQRELVAAQQQEVDKAKVALDQAQQNLSAERQKLATLNTKLGQSFSAAELKEFISLRATAADYKSGLGLLATLRNDFENLSRLLKEQQGERTDAAAPAPVVERIVLFIDDLDRCPPDRVVEVLQAVHLLLAFQLFVVVVGVDARWIASSLEKRHADVLGDTTGAAARSSDYLEKIFQVPYWLSPFTRTDAGAYFRALLGDAGSPLAPRAASNAGASPDAADATTSAALGGDPGNQSEKVPANAVLWTPEERAFVSGLAPIAGATPRATKRFFNLYNLLRHHPMLWPSLDERVASDQTNSTYRAYAYALAMANSGQRGAEALAQRRKKPPSPAIPHAVLNANGDVLELLKAGWSELATADDEEAAVVEIALRLSFHGHLLVSETPLPPQANTAR